MQLSIHYYVLSLSEQMCRLYEGFRDKLIDIQDANFPMAALVQTDHPGPAAAPDVPVRKFFHQTDRHFVHYYQQDPLRLVVAGEMENLAIFKTLTSHRDAIIGTVKGDYTDTSAHDLGKIVWPVVKEAIAGVNKNALHDLSAAADRHKVVSGIDAVGKSVESESGATLYVEEDYHVKGSIHKSDHAVIILKHVNLWEVLDDVVDIIIEKVLKMNGRVIFLNSGALLKLDRIALIVHG
jgi:hypothetical protein